MTRECCGTNRLNIIAIWVTTTRPRAADNVSATVQFVSPILLNCSRGVRWDSDHVTRLNDDLRAVCNEAVRSGRFDDLIWATDFFDASINRLAA